MLQGMCRRTLQRMPRVTSQGTPQGMILEKPAGLLREYLGKYLENAFENIRCSLFPILPSTVQGFSFVCLINKLYKA